MATAVKEKPMPEINDEITLELNDEKINFLNENLSDENRYGSAVKGRISEKTTTDNSLILSIDEYTYIADVCVTTQRKETLPDNHPAYTIYNEIVDNIYVKE